jgi:mRNA interferase MazF
MSDLRVGDVVTVDFPGVQGIKCRPVVVVSSSTYHQYRPDIIVGIVTSQVERAVTPTDYVLKDWRESGLYRESAFRTFLVTPPTSGVKRIGRCSRRDWQAIEECLQKGIGG